MKSRRRIPTTLALTALAMPAAAIAGLSDAWITTKAKLAIVSNVGTTASNVNVDTVDGQVTLHGTVPTEIDKQNTEEAARNLDGVSEVRNLVQVVRPEEATSVSSADLRIHEQVSDALAGDRDLADSSIEIASVHRGVVLLEGRAESIPDLERALELTEDVPGVTEVHTGAGLAATTRGRIDDPVQRATETGRDLSADVASAADNAWVATAVKTRLLASASTPGLDVEVENGVVTLNGTVPTEAAKESAEQEARLVKGVERVDNRLRVAEEEEAE